MDFALKQDDLKYIYGTNVWESIRKICESTEGSELGYYIRIYIGYMYCPYSQLYLVFLGEWKDTM